MERSEEHRADHPYRDAPLDPPGAAPPVQRSAAPPVIAPPVQRGPAEWGRVQPPVRLDEAGRIDEDRPCRHCGYSLAGLLPDGACPECATPIEKSIRPDLLHFADPAWVKRLARGLWLILGGQVAGIVGGVLLAVAIVVMFSVAGAGGAAAGGMPNLRPAIWGGAALGGVTSLIAVIGIWLLTSPEAGSEERAQTWRSPRVIARWCAPALIISAVLQVFWQQSMPGFGGMGGFAITPVAVAGVAAGIVALVAWIGVFLHGRDLLLRVPAPSLARQVLIVMWGLVATQAIGLVVAAVSFVVIPVLAGGGGAAPAPPMGAGMGIMAVGGCITGAGGTVFGIWGLVLLIITVTVLNRVAREAEAAW